MDYVQDPTSIDTDRLGVFIYLRYQMQFVQNLKLALSFQW